MDILGKPQVHFTSIYSLEGIVSDYYYLHVCTEKATGIKYSCIILDRETDIAHVFVEVLRRFIKIWELMMSMKQHPNSIMELKGAYEDEKNLYLVMELCSADALDKWRSASREAEESNEEDEQAYLFWQVVNAIHAFHSMGVMIRSLSPENFLFLPEDRGKLLIKAAYYFDALLINELGNFERIIDEPDVKAPEMEKEQNYGKEVDIWSAGVILYSLLTDDYGSSINHVKDYQERLDAWINEKLSRKSDAAKDLLKKMLKLDPKERITAAEALEHPWLKYANVTVPDLNQSRKLRRFHYMVEVLVKSLPEEENKCLKQLLNNMDTYGSTMRLEELEIGLSQLAHSLPDSEIMKLNEAAKDFCGTEYVSDIMHRHKLEDENIRKAFLFFEKDGDGFITRNDLGQAMAPYRIEGEAAIDEIIDDVDTDKDGKIEYGDFKAMIKKEMHDHDEKQRKLKF